MDDESLEEYLRDLVSAAVTIADNVESIALTLRRAAEKEYPHDNGQRDDD